MKKVLKFLLIFIGIIVLVVVAGVLFIQVKGIPTYKTEELNYKVTVTPEKVARGKKLATVLCAGCHMNYDTRKLTGKLMLDAPPEFGKVYSQNITQDETYGIGSWTDGEILYLLRTGIKKNGQYAPPYMAKLPHMADEDIEAVIAFLHSDDPMVQAAKVPDHPCEPSLLTKFLCRVAFKPLPLPEKRIEMPDTNNPVEFGRYLVYNLECYTCHSADFKKLNVMDPPKTPGYLGGGNKPLNMEGQVMLTQNITPDKETGIGNWTEEQFVKAVKYGIKEGEPSLRYPMMPYAQLTDKEAKAIFAYLQTVPPIKNDVPRMGLEQ